MNTAKNNYFRVEYTSNCVLSNLKYFPLLPEADNDQSALIITEKFSPKINLEIQQRLV